MSINTPWREERQRVFEAHAAAVIGGYAPQVRYRTSDGRWLVIWQGDIVTFRDGEESEATAIADHRIAMALVGLFQDDRIAQLSRAVLHDDAPPELLAGESTKQAPRLRQVADGFEVSDGTFTATYDDYKVAERVCAWLANPDDARPLDVVVHGQAEKANKADAPPPAYTPVRDAPQA